MTFEEFQAAGRYAPVFTDDSSGVETGKWYPGPLFIQKYKGQWYFFWGMTSHGPGTQEEMERIAYQVFLQGV